MRNFLNIFFMTLVICDTQKYLTKETIDGIIVY